MTKINDILNRIHFGKIVKVNYDPEKPYVCKILVFGVFGNINENIKYTPIDIDNLPDAYPFNYNHFGTEGSGIFSSPKLDQIVRVKFEENFLQPRYISNEELDPGLVELLKNEYDDFQSFCLDSSSKLFCYYSKNSGLVLDFNTSLINIKPDNSILIKHSDSLSIMEFKGEDIDIVTNNSVNISSTNNVTVNSKKIHVNGEETDVGANPIFSSVNGEILFELLKVLATAIDNKYPITPTVSMNIVNNLKDQLLSGTVKVSP